jgi:polyisoprenoid-binding protein YceI
MNQAARAAWACAIVLLMHAAAAQAERWTIDPRDSSAGFRVRLFALLPLRGGFGAFAGTIDVDRRARCARVDARIDASSVVMPNPSHTDWVKSAEFFDVATFPEIRFRSAEFPLALLVDGGELDGNLSLRGRTRGVRFAVEPGQCAVDGAETCTVVVRGNIRRSDYGMSARRGAISDTVSLDLRIVAHRATIEAD